MGSWYWIYFVAPLVAAFAVSEVTALMEMNVEEEDAMEQAKKDDDAKGDDNA